MTDDGRRTRGTGVSLLLPSSWWTVDLPDPDARARRVRTLVERSLGRADEAARLRADLRTRLGRAADQAAAAGGVLMAVSLMRVGDLPLPATLTVYRVPGLRLDAAGIEALTATLREPVPEALDVAQGEDGSPVVRRVRLRRGDAELGAEDVTQLVVDYWRALGGGGPVVQLTFGTPMVQVTSAMLELFDTVVASAARLDGTGDDMDDVDDRDDAGEPAPSGV
ncbi:hypothetical protein [Cellulomonas hominis]